MRTWNDRPYLVHKLSMLILVASLLVGCQAGWFEKPTSSGREILFEDDFEDPTSGWNRVAAASGESDYADGMYRILVNDVNLDIWARPGLTYTDVVIEVSALKVGGDRNNRFGIVCRVVSPSDFYALMVSSDGFYGIGKIKDDQFSLIDKKAFQPTAAVIQGSAINRLRADCVGDTLTLYVNDQKVAAAKDAEFTFGDVGLIAGSYDTAGVDIRFDNFLVTKP